MSYSISVTAVTKAAALVDIEGEIAKVVADQPEHAQDQAQALANAKAALAILADNAGKEIILNLNGSLGCGVGEGEMRQITSATVNVSARWNGIGEAATQPALET